MPSTETLIAFAAAAAVFAWMPGPALLYTAAQTVARGRRAGLLAALGLHLGGYVHVVAAAAGLSALFHAVPALYAAVKLAGAAYLVWLGLGMVLGAARRQAALPEFVGGGGGGGRRAFAESIAVEVLNPKTAVFFIAFLPQFTAAGAAWPIWAQLLTLGTAVNVMFSSADLVCVALAGAVVERFRRSGTAERIARATGGSILVGLGVHLALQRA